MDHAAPTPSGSELSSDELREHVIGCHRIGLWLTLAGYVDEFADRIRVTCLSWVRTLEPPHDDLAKVREAASAFRALALELDAEGDPRMLRAIDELEARDPVLCWERSVGDFDRLRGDVADFQAAPTRLERLLTADHGGTGLRERYRSQVLGRLGEVHLHLGRAEVAIGHLEAALRLAASEGDADAERRYALDLYEAHRYLAQGAAAADYADRAAGLFERAGGTKEANRYRARAAVARAGEPALRVVFDLHETTYEREQARHRIRPLVQPYSTSDIAIPVVERNRVCLEASLIHYRKAGSLIRNNECDQAMAELERAAAIDPFNPDVPRSAAFTHMANGRYAEAAKAYDAADALAPGWDTCRADAWLCRQLSRKRWRSRVLHAILLSRESPQIYKSADKLMAVEKALADAPDCAALHLARAENLPHGSDQPLAIEAYQAGLRACDDDDFPPWGQDYHTRTGLLLGLGGASRDRETKVRLYRQAATLDDRGSRIRAAYAWIELRALGEDV